MSSMYNPQLVGMVDVRQLAQLLSRNGDAEVVMREFCAIYGFELYVDEDVQFRLNAKSPDNLYAEGIWKRDPETGAVTYERDSVANTPQWVQEAHAKMRGTL